MSLKQTHTTPEHPSSYAFIEAGVHGMVLHMHDPIQNNMSRLFQHYLSLTWSEIDQQPPHIELTFQLINLCVICTFFRYCLVLRALSKYLTQSLFMNRVHNLLLCHLSIICVGS